MSEAEIDTTNRTEEQHMKVKESTELNVEAEAVDDGIWFRWGKLCLHLSAREEQDEKYIRIHVGNSADEVTTDASGPEMCIPVESPTGLGLEVR